MANLAHERRLSPHTLRAYGDDFARFLAFQTEHLGRAPDARALSVLSPADIRAFIAQRRSDGLGARSVRRALSAIRSFFRYLARENIADNPASRAVRTPRLARTLPRPLSETDAARTVALAGENNTAWIAARDAALLTLLYGAGLRISEALGLRRGDAPLGDWLTVLGKRNKERAVPVLPVMREVMARYEALLPFPAAADGPLFVSRRGKAMSAREAQLLMQRLRGALGLPDRATPHALRHSFASHLLANGGELRAVQELLGHASLSSTQVYTEIDTRKLLAAYEGAHPRAKLVVSRNKDAESLPAKPARRSRIPSTSQ
ncbi:MAG TPA: tyrosine recombinase XerC [Rhizomicrobium sp.]|jgi:integrase/recombinase XerC